MGAGFVAAAIAIAAALPAQASREAYAWPLELPRELTSSFGEYRPGRYHMGIDLRTGPIGKNVYAAADGHVSRIRCSPYGYGKAIYLQLDDGNTAVYAHLSEFSPALTAYVRAAQHAREEYMVELTPKPGEFRVKRGELIAKSGQTGIGVPHLHYELRDREGVPINPRALGVAWPDRTPPVLLSIALVPLTAESFAGGDFRGRDVTKFNGQDRGIFVDGPAEVSGRFGVAIRAFDPGEQNASLGIYRATLSFAGREAFTVRNDRISYDFADDGVIAFGRIHPVREAPHYLRLWRMPGNDSEPYGRSVSADGAIELIGEAAELEVVIEDFAGNAASFAVALRRAGPEPEAPEDTQLRGNGRADFEFNGHSLVVTAEFPGDEVERPVLVVDGEQLRRIPFRRMEARRYQIALLPEGPGGAVDLRVEHPRLDGAARRYVLVRRGEAMRSWRFGDLEITTHPDTPYGVLGFEAITVAAEPGPELTPLSKGYDIRPHDIPVDTSIALSLPLPGEARGPERASFYRRDEAKRVWVRQESSGDGRRISASTRRLGVYAVFEDATAPEIGILLSEKKGVVLGRRPAIAAKAIDRGSGVETWRVTYAGKWLLTEYDPERDVLSWEQDEDLPEGPGALVVEVRDHAGNVSRAERVLEIR